MKEKEKQSTTLGYKITTIVGVILCIILLPILVLNITLITKSYATPNEVPNVAGIVPMVVLTDSMYPTIESGDVIITNKVESSDVKVNDIITFFDPDGSGTTITHRVIEITEQDGQIAFKTKGDANNSEDKSLVTADQLVGMYNTRIKGAGKVSMFMSTTTGLVICIVIPLIVIIGWDLIRRNLHDKKYNNEREALLKEIEELRKEKQANNESN